MKVDILLSGAGGQGLMSLGRIMAYAAIRENKFTTYIPSYGAEVRGGTAYCYVKISDKPIKSPLVEDADAAIILNQQSLDKFKDQLGKKCTLIINSDLIENKPQLPVKKTIYLGLNKIALACGDVKAANITALGAFLFLMPGILKKETIIEVLREVFRANNSAVEINIRALAGGQEAVSKD